jgi:hypothetical protein
MIRCLHRLRSRSYCQIYVRMGKVKLLPFLARQRVLELCTIPSVRPLKKRLQFYSGGGFGHIGMAFLSGQSCHGHLRCGDRIFFPQFMTEFQSLVAVLAAVAVLGL